MPDQEPILIVGRAAIAIELGTNLRHVDALIAEKKLPFIKLGGKVALRRQALLNHFRAKEDEQAQ